MEDIKVTLVQTCLYWGDRTKNLKNIESKIQNVETDLIVLPEMFIDPYGKPMIVIQKDRTETVKLNYDIIDKYRKDFQVGLDWDEFSIK